MTFAYEVALEDVFLILEAHGIADSEEEEVVYDAYSAIREVADQIAEAVLDYVDTDQRRAAAQREMEAILIEEGLLDGPPLLTPED
jgi:hypothetical protein